MYKDYMCKDYNTIATLNMRKIKLGRWGELIQSHTFRVKREAFWLTNPLSKLKRQDY